MFPSVDPHFLPWWGWLLCAGVAFVLALFARLVATLVKWVAWVVVVVAGVTGAVLYLWPMCCARILP